MAEKERELVRCSVRSLKDRRPAYGRINDDGTFTEEDGTIHEKGTWWRSRQSNIDEQDE